jgi:hypothetical protein
MQRMFIKKYFLFTVGSFLSCKAIHNWVKKFSEGRSKVADDARPGAEVAETTVWELLCCWLRRTDKAMGQVYQCWGMICRVIYVFSRLEYHMFYVLYPFVAYLLTLPHTLSSFALWDQGRPEGRLETGMLTISPINSILCDFIYALFILRSEYCTLTRSIPT